MSFRRQVQVMILPNVTPPDHLNISYNGGTYRVFVSTDSVRCFECGELGHVSRACKKVANQDPIGKGKSDPKHPPKKSVNQHPDPTTAPPKTPTHGAGPSNANHDPTPTESPRPQKENSPTRQLNDTAPPPDDSNRSPHRDAPSCSSVWGSPPRPVRLFSDVVSKRKQDPPTSAVETSQLTVLESRTPPRKLMKKASSPTSSNPTPTPTKSSNPASSGLPTPGRATPTLSTPVTPSPATPTLTSNPPSPIPPSPASVQDSSITDAAMWEDAQTSDDESVDWASSFPSSQGPLSDKQLIHFLKVVKSRKKPLEIARKFTPNIPGLVRQLRPLRNSPLFKKSTQQRISKLINKLDDCM
ncbi:uncharacterized protein [Diadema setosum]|uniref:uncharacterized protein n=1 Tax=Diadema setosum TaxID=31175 RepID=UPI003B3B9362